MFRFACNGVMVCEAGLIEALLGLRQGRACYPTTPQAPQVPPLIKHYLQPSDFSTLPPSARQ